MDIHIRGRKKAWLKKDKIMKENNIEKTTFYSLLQNSFWLPWAQPEEKKLSEGITSRVK